MDRLAFNLNCVPSESPKSSNPKEWMTSYFFLRYQLWINYEGRVNNENDQQFQKSLIVNQILHFKTIGNVKITVWRI